MSVENRDSDRQKLNSTGDIMTVLLVLVTFGGFLLLDWIFGKHPVVQPDIRYFDHTGDQFAELGFTMADGGTKICPTCGK
jgi:hypothetical protein